MFYSGVAAFALRCAPSEGLVRLSSYVERFSSLQLAIGNSKLAFLGRGLSSVGRAPQLSERAQPGQWINAQWTTMDKANLTTAFPAYQDRARIVFDCRTGEWNPVKMSSTIPATLARCCGFAFTNPLSKSRITRHNSRCAAFNRLKL